MNLEESESIQSKWNRKRKALLEKLEEGMRAEIDGPTKLGRNPTLACFVDIRSNISILGWHLYECEQTTFTEEAVRTDKLLEDLKRLEPEMRNVLLENWENLEPHITQGKDGRRLLESSVDGIIPHVAHVWQAMFRVHFLVTSAIRFVTTRLDYKPPYDGIKFVDWEKVLEDSKAALGSAKAISYHERVRGIQVVELFQRSLESEKPFDQSEWSAEIRWKTAFIQYCCSGEERPPQRHVHEKYRIFHPYYNPMLPPDKKTVRFREYIEEAKEGDIGNEITEQNFLVANRKAHEKFTHPNRAQTEIPEEVHKSVSESPEAVQE